MGKPIGSALEIRQSAAPAAPAAGNTLLYSKAGDRLYTMEAGGQESLLMAVRIVRVATTAPITLSGLQTIDGVTVVAGNRVLVMNQAAAKDNGIYVAASGAWARATDADTTAELSRTFVLPTEGAVNANKYMWSGFPATGVLGTDSINFVANVDIAQFAAVATSGSASDLTAGTLLDARLPSRLGALATVIADLNSATAPGWYAASNTTTNTPVAGNYYNVQVSTYNATGSASQVAYDGNGSATWVRQQIGGSWGAWRQTNPELFTVKDSTASASMRAQAMLTGSTSIVVDGSYNVSWVGRFNAVSIGSGSHFSTAGYFDISMPPNGTVIPGVGGATNQTVAGGVINLPSFYSLFYILPIGSGATSLAANFRLVYLTAGVVIPDHWIEVVQHHGDAHHFRWANGINLLAGHSWNVLDPRDMVHLGNVDNTSDANKPISIAEQAALNLKQDLAAISVKAASTANLTLSGTQTVDTIALVAGDQVLVKNQTAPAENGVYTVAAGAWTRAPGWATALAISGQVAVAVRSGNQGGTHWRTTFKSSDTLGTTALNWYQTDVPMPFGGSGPSPVQSGQMWYDQSNGRAIVYDGLGIAYTFAGADNSVRAVATSNVASLSGTTTVDGVALNLLDLVLLTGQTTPSQNGVYYVLSGAWSRAMGWTTALGVARQKIVTVREGTIYGGTIWATSLKGSDTVGTTAMNWAQNFTAAMISASQTGTITLPTGTWVQALLDTQDANASPGAAVGGLTLASNVINVAQAGVYCLSISGTIATGPAGRRSVKLEGYVGAAPGMGLATGYLSWFGGPDPSGGSTLITYSRDQYIPAGTVLRACMYQTGGTNLVGSGCYVSVRRVA